MASLPLDLDRKQSMKDMFYMFARNDYRLVDEYVIRDGKKHPFALLVPGGGYNFVCNYIEGLPIAKKLNAKGISAFILYYHVGKKALYPAPQDDLARAVREIFENSEKYDLITDNYSIWGSSAGGHLVSTFGTDNMGYLKYGLPKPGLLVLEYPVISMDPEITHDTTHDRMAGKNPTKELEDFLSSDKHVTADYPKTFIWCGTEDTCVKPENTKRMAAALEKAHVPYHCEIIEGAEHGVGPGTGTPAEGWIDRAVDYWDPLNSA